MKRRQSRGGAASLDSMSTSTPPARIVSLRDSAPAPITNDGAQGTSGQPLLDRADGNGDLDLRVVTIRPGGLSADHAHAWVQANLVLSGSGTVAIGDEVYAVGPDDFVYVPPNVRHVFSNTGAGDLRLLSVLGPRH